MIRVITLENNHPLYVNADSLCTCTAAVVELSRVHNINAAGDSPSSPDLRSQTPCVLFSNTSCSKSRFDLTC